ncbi:TPA: cysteine hydrolase [Candidatus Sumerlaeota bacterium]|jgi:nicotinamidase-related amidase|nr:cysteine hydrolase [Candidatus Sumerlaeota bacterium]
MKRALIVIDVQNVYFSDKLRVTWPEDSFVNILCAMDEAIESNIPIIVVQHSSAAGLFAKGSHGWELHPEIAKRPYALLVEKTLPGSFTGTQLESWLRENEIERVVIAGYMTQMCCDTTSRQAFHLGFSVEFLSDATGTLAFTNAAGSVKDEELHRAILVTQQFRFAEVLNTNDWLERIKTEK